MPNLLYFCAPIYDMTSGYKSYILIAAGCLSTILGAIGVVVPGLPTTPFVLLASWCFYRSSPRLQKWLLSPFLGKYIRDYTARGGLTLSKRLMIIGLMTAMVTISIVFFIHSTAVRCIVGVAGVVGCIVVGFVVPKAHKDNTL